MCQHRVQRAAAVLIAATGFLAAPAEAAPFAYTPNFISSNVSVVDIATNSVVATIPVGMQTSSTAVSADGTRVYVANNTGSISVIDGTTQSVIQTIPLPGASPISLGITPNGQRVYVANSGGTVSVIDTASLTLTQTITVSGAPYGAVVNPAGTRVYVSSNVSVNNVAVIDTATNTVVATIPGGGNNGTGIAISPDGARVYTANAGSASITVMNTATNTAVTTVPVAFQPTGIAVTPDGTRVYVANYGGSVSVIDAASNVVLTTIATGGQPWGICATADGTHMYFTSEGEDTLRSIDTATNTVVATIPVGAAPNGVGQFIRPARSAATTTASSDANPSVFGQNVTLTAAVSGTGATPTGTVTFLDGSTTLGSAPLAAGSTSIATSTLAVGSHAVVAQYAGDGAFSPSSGNLTQVVDQAASANVLSSDINPSTPGQVVTFTATLSAVAPGSGTPTGTVAFLDDSTQIGTATLGASGIATFATGTLPPAVHSITAVYAGDVNFNASVSNALSQTTPVTLQSFSID
jgi:YVTN family beta-propeller protein